LARRQISILKGLVTRQWLGCRSAAEYHVPTLAATVRGG